MADIEYPNGCRPVSENLGADELIRRLKVCAICIIIAYIFMIIFEIQRILQKKMKCNKLKN